MRFNQPMRIRQWLPVASAFAPAATTAIPSGRHAGVATYRHARYDAACHCYHYTSDLIKGR